MQKIRNRDTAPELYVRRLIHSLGFRFRLHRRDLPGTPDLVFSSLRKAIFVHGCFWHRHDCRKGRSMPSTRTQFWRDKLNGNKRRDVASHRKLRRLGWSVLIVWECQVTRLPQQSLERRLVGFLTS